MTATPHVLLFDDAPRLAQLVRNELQERGFSSDPLDFDVRSKPELLETADLAVFVLDQHRTLAHAGDVLELMEGLAGAKVPTLVWGMPEQIGAPTGPLLDCVPSDANLDEVVARLTTLARYAPMVRQLERELTSVQRLGGQLNRYFSEIDQELRLAGRLQRDFLPTKLPQVPPLTFAALYRPASWVSGDMYDVFRIDENHVGVFMTDAMGHGIAAGLLTMFLRQALVAKRVSGHGYQIVSPAEAMANLNNCLLRQKLPSCQFVTAMYAIIELDGLALRMARGGHPYPIHIRADGTIRELPAPGGLLGVPELPADFGENHLRLDPGDRLLFYTDGVEDVFVKPSETSTRSNEFTDELRKLAHLDVHHLISELGRHLDQREGSLHPSDDATVLAMEVTR